MTPISQFGRYRLEGPLAAGGMAVVYRALVELPNGIARAVAIKRMRPDLASDPGFRTMLLDEGRLTVKLRHPNIVEVLECGEVDGELYLAMELIDGLDLRALMKASRAAGKPIPPAVCAYIVGRLASALGHAHRLQDESGPLRLVHRDVSPTNVMLRLDGTVKLLDFGIAKAAHMLRNEATRTGVVKGKFAYMSPEQASGAEVDGRSDLFALGIVLYELLTLEQLFRGANDLATLQLVIKANVPSVHPRWDSILARLLAPTPELRFASGEEVEQALIHLAGSTGAAELGRFIAQVRPAVATPEPLPLDPTVTFVSNKASEASVPRPSKPSGSRWPVLAALVALGAAAAVGVLSTLTHNEPPLVAPLAPVLAPVQNVAPSVAGEGSKPTAAARVAFEVRGTNAAQVLVDGETMGAVPLSIELPARATSRQVRIEKQGWVPAVREVPGDSAVLLEVDLKAVARIQPRPPKKSKQSTPDIPDPFR